MKRFIVALAALCVFESHAAAQQQANAALRYWMAFALMKDPPADAATFDGVVAVESGTVPWDERRLGSTFGPVLDANADALAIMRRASTVPFCDWGVEYELGPSAPIAHLAKGRVLGRLNTLSGARLATRGQLADAVEIWLTGIRFSQHLARGGTVISLASASAPLFASLNNLANVAAQPSLSAELQRRIQATVQALPEGGLDYADAMRREADLFAIGVRTNTIPNFTSRDLISRVDPLVAQVIAALRLPPDRTKTVLAGMNLRFFPLASPEKINDTRREMRSARQRVLDALRR